MDCEECDGKYVTDKKNKNILICNKCGKVCIDFKKTKGKTDSEKLSTLFEQFKEMWEGVKKKHGIK